MSSTTASAAGGGCSTPGCTNIVAQRLACPRCIKLGIPPAYFCSQKCFVANYPNHKSIHSLAKQILQQQQQQHQESTSAISHEASDGISCLPTENANVKLSLPIWAAESRYRFTGTLRPTLISPRRVVPAHIPRPDYASHPGGVSESEQRDRASNSSLRIYSKNELDGEDRQHGLRHACRMGREVLDLAGKACRVGVTDEIDRVVHEACMERECYPSPLNYYQFPKSVCTSVNEVICHGIPDYREIQDGDIVNVDVTTFNRGGYHGDLNETFMVGKVDDDGQRLVKTAFDCLAKALSMVKPGTLYRDLGTAIHKTAQANGCSVVRTYCGHGIGSLFHTAPNVPHYHKNKAKGIMKKGHVFTVEPMINLGVYSDKTWDDNWTAVTSDGRRSAQFEHTVMVTENGCEILTARDNEPIMVWNTNLLQK